NMSHELRTPLNAVIGFSEMIKTETLGPVGDPQYLDYAKDIHESSAHLLDVINDVLDLSKIEAGQFELREETVDLGDLLRKSARLIEERARWADLRLEVEIPTSLPALRADERALKQIVINLLSNAIKFTRAGGTIRLAAGHDDHGAIWLKVRDDGIGMKPEQIPIALAPFRQVESGLSRRFEGTGLGLPLTAAMVDLHGGTVAIDSVSGEGTTVTVELPADRVVPARDVA
ncbi:MAG: HAMP domain-containing sensor histidine kinase, partial [Alphaproteobacteria bacterium]